MTAIHDSEAKHICHTCIGDQFLADEVKKEGTSDKCNYCGKTRGVLTLEELANLTHAVLEEHFELTPSEPDALDYALMRERLVEWYREGQPVEGVIADIAGLTEQVAGDVCALLFGRYQYEAMREGEENPYDSDAFYEESSTDDWKFPETWNAFRTEIRSRTRFFSRSTERMLHDIFGDLNSLRAYPSRPVVLEIGPEDENRFIWRARQALSTLELKAMLISPASQIGPPPSRLTRSGRMNAQGIPVFYGAMDKSTCISEIRPPVGSYVVLAKFEMLRPMRLLDLLTLKEVYVGGSYFDPEYGVRKARAEFLRDLVSELSQPVMPQDEAVEYLTTQVVAEYLANKVEPRLDGMIYTSSQTGGDGRNVVLFNHACRVEPRDQSHIVNFRINVPPVREDTDDDDGISILEYVRTTPPSKLPMIEQVPEWSEDGLGDDDDPMSYDEPALRLDLDSIVVLDIRGVEYTSNSRELTRSRTNAPPSSTEVF